jgi:flagellar hook-associated protein 1
MIKHLQNYREEVSGVSLDEEMVNLIKYQHAYNAAAKLITTTDEMMQTLIGLVR